MLCMMNCSSVAMLFLVRKRCWLTMGGNYADLPTMPYFYVSMDMHLTGELLCV